MLDDDYGGLLLGGEPSLFKEQTLLSSTLNSTSQSAATFFSKNPPTLMTDPLKLMSPSMANIATNGAS